MPATDSFTKQWMIERLRRNRYRRGPEAGLLLVHTVLGPDLTREDPVRLAGLLKHVDPSLHHVPWDMGSEDFLGLVGRDAILKPSATGTGA